MSRSDSPTKRCRFFHHAFTRHLTLNEHHKVISIRKNRTPTFLGRNIYGCPGFLFWFFGFLLYGNWTIQSPRLTIPHAQMQIRNFVLCPLLDVAPGLVLSDGQPLSVLVEKLGYGGLSVIAEDYPWLMPLIPAPG